MKQPSWLSFQSQCPAVNVLCFTSRSLRLLKHFKMCLNPKRSCKERLLLYLEACAINPMIIKKDNQCFSPLCSRRDQLFTNEASSLREKERDRVTHEGMETVRLDFGRS